MFAKDDYDLGSYNGAVHHIDTGDAKPIHCRPHLMPHRLRPVLREELDDMERRGYIEPSSSSWAAPIVYVRKPRGGWRLCVDFRRLNAVAKINVYPLPRIQDIFSALSGARYFSSLDLAKGFWQIRIDEASKEKTAFTTCYGLFQFARLPMGLATAPGAFQEAMSAVLAGLNWVHAMVYLDDVLIYTPTFEKHLEVLDDVFKRFQKADLKAKLDKCEFARTQLQYLGHVINSKGIQPDGSKVAAVKGFTAPSSRKELETFLGKAGYYCRFIQNFSKIAYPLFQLKRNDVEWKWGAAEQLAFDTLKERLCEAPVLRHPDFDRPFFVQTDASGYGIGAVLSQEFEDGEHPIAYASRTLKDAETRYATIEREALGIHWGVRYFEQYLLGGHFTVITDHKPLESMMNKDHQNTRIENYVLKLQHFDFDIQYKEGADNGNADALSRAKYPVIELRTQKSKRSQCALGPETLKAVQRLRKKMATAIVAPVLKGPKGKKPSRKERKQRARVQRKQGKKQQEAAQAEESEEDADPDALWDTVPTGAAEMSTVWGKLRRAQAHDPLFGPIRRYLEEDLQDGDAPRLARVDTGKFWLSEEGYLVRLSQGTEDIVVCVPQILVPYALELSHDSPWAGHLGGKGTQRKARKDFWWPRMASDCAEYVKRCATCARYKIAARRAVVPLGAMSVPSAVWQRLHVDIWSVGDAKDGSKGVIAFIDAFSKYAIMEPVADYTAATFAHVFIQKVAPVFGAAELLISDGGPAFIAEFQAAFFRACGVARKICVPYNPQSNGKIERLFQTQQGIVAALAQKHPRSWPVMLPHACFAYNTAYHRAIDQTPFFVMYGRDPMHIYGFLRGRFQVAEKGSAEVLQEMREVRQLVRKKLTEQGQKYKREYDMAVAKFYKNLQFYEDQLVWAKSEVPAGAIAKLSPKYVGPFRIKYLGDVAAGIVPLAFPNRPPKMIHLNKLKACLSDETLGSMDEKELCTPFWLDPNLESEEEEETADASASAEAEADPKRKRTSKPRKKARITVQLSH